MSIVDIKNLTKFYGKARGIIDVSFQVEEGEIVGFIGPNGAGKSTTIRCLLSLIYPTSGSATIFGKEVIRFSHEIKKDIGYLPSEVFYYEGMRAIDLLNYSASFYRKDCGKRIRELSDALDLDITRKIDDLSYGNRKKVGIIQGLLHSPKLIILDEPTGGLDPLIQQKFFDLLREENKKGCSILFSSHILGEVQKLCKRVAIIKEGRIIQDKDISALTEHTYKKVKVETLSSISPEFFHLEGMSNLVVDGSSASFIYMGIVNPMLHELSQLSLKDIIIEDPTLEEVFMHFYGKKETSK